ncbi:SGNH hydrolase-type esterase domain containing protein [uncultured Caudovirales phage]|uniref:SGNH hydrolase-type esterase domain containing protein n=1 Tax=uncultured Caudovirales phage TaxID=2100421 RepID=A0A6J5T0B2_9CAUD|nr:SGNH hydrolase-type esterase domain containing protein [uncultured Caudovirales phage]
MAALISNHLVIVPETNDIAMNTTSVSSTVRDYIHIELFGDSIMCGRDPDELVPAMGVCSKNDQITARVPEPPARLLTLLMPQHKLIVTTRSQGNSTSGELLQGKDGVNEPWPDAIQANIVVINHGLNDAKQNVSLTEYRNNLISLRRGLTSDQIMIWQTPTVSKFWDTNPYAEVMREVAAKYKDMVADANRIPNWLNELPDGIHPRQLGYYKLVDLCLTSKINSAIIKLYGQPHLPYKWYRKEHQEKFLLDNEKLIELPFVPHSQRWVEVYHRDNLSFRAVSRGALDIYGKLDAGLWDSKKDVAFVYTQRSYNLSRIRRTDGKVVFNKNFDIYGNPVEAKNLAKALNATSSDYIIVITTSDEPKTNRLTTELTEAMYRCGASENIFSSTLFKFRSAYALVGIPGCGKGNGIEAYNGCIDGNPASTSPQLGLRTTEFLFAYPFTNPKFKWSSLLNAYGVWDDSISAQITNTPAYKTTILEGSKTNAGVATGTLILQPNTPKLLARFIVDSLVTSVLDTISPASTPTIIGSVVLTTVGQATPAMLFGDNDKIGYISIDSMPKLNLAFYALSNYTIEFWINRTVDKRGGVVICKNTEYEIFIETDGKLSIALDWNQGSDLTLPGGKGLIYTTATIPLSTLTHVALVVTGTELLLYLDGVIDVQQNNLTQYLNRTSQPSANPVTLGNREGAATAANQLYAYILDVRIWDEARTASQIFSNMNLANTIGSVPSVYYDIGVVPLLKNFTIDIGATSTEDMILIGYDVSADDLVNFGIQTSINNIRKVEYGDIITWSSKFTVEFNYTIGYWIWTVSELPTIPLTGVLYHNNYPGKGTTSIINYNEWIVGSGSIPGYTQNGNTNENERVFGTNPWSNTDVVWEARPTSDNQADGGWETPWFDIDNTKTYRFSVWVKRTSTAAGGYFYLGMYGNNGGACRMDTGDAEPNPYWDYRLTSQLTQNQWYLFVGHVYPATTTLTGKHPDSGYYTTAGKVGDNNGGTIGTGDIKWGLNSTQGIHRTYLYYCDDNATRLQFYRPRVDLCDGTEPMIVALLEDNIVTNRNYDEQSGLFTVPDSFTSTSIIVFGVGDSMQGMNDVTFTIDQPVTSLTWSNKYYNWQVFFPKADEYIFSLSADTSANLQLKSNIGIQSDADITEVLKTSGSPSYQYKNIETTTYVINDPGWYDIKIYAETANTLIRAPEYYSSPTTVNGQWSTLINNFGVWDGPGEYKWYITILNSGKYTFNLSADDIGSLYLSRTEFNAEFELVVETNQTSDTGNFTNIFTAEKFLNEGDYIIKIIADTTGSSAAIAASLTDYNNDIIWSSANVKNPTDIIAKGLAASVRTIAGSTIWNTRTANNLKNIDEHGKEKLCDMYNTYCEINFDIAQNGTPFVVDIYPPSPNRIDSNGVVLPIKAPFYDMIKNVPPVNGTRMINASYNTDKHEYSFDSYNFVNKNTIVFSKAMSGMITVISDTTSDVSGNALTIPIQNIQSYQTFKKTFTHGRWSQGSPNAPVPWMTPTPGSAPIPVKSGGPLATPVVKTATDTNNLKLYNTHIMQRVGPGKYSEPIVLSQPQHGYVRITDNRRNFAYVPFPDYEGLDTFTYTLLTQTGQMGPPKSVYINVIGSISYVYELEVNIIAGTII